MARRPKKNIYHIIMVSRGKQIHDLYHTPYEKMVNKKFLEMIRENENVEFPVMTINDDGFKEADYQLVIIKRRDDSDDEITILRDNFGRMEEYASSDDDWIIYDKHQWMVEETFWIYGRHPKIDRKPARWVLDEMVMDGTDRLTPKSIGVFKNKLIIDSKDGISMVICKTVQDCIRLYNFIEEKRRGRRSKYVFFIGRLDEGHLKNKWVERIVRLTGWSHKKILRSSTRP